MRLAAVLLEEAERRHIAKELHDEVGQSLTALKLRLQVAEASEQVVQARALVDELLDARVEPVARSASGDARRSRPSAGARVAVRALHVADDGEGRVRARRARRAHVADRRDGRVPHRAGGADQRRAPRRRAVGDGARVARRRVAVGADRRRRQGLRRRRRRRCRHVDAGCRACASARRRSAARWTSSLGEGRHAPDRRAALAVDAGQRRRWVQAHEDGDPARRRSPGHHRWSQGAPLAASRTWR